MRRISMAVVLLVVIVLGSTGLLRAQAEGAGTITGTVRDDSGAVVPGADVAVSNEQTGLNRTGVSNDQGAFRFAALPVGLYSLSVELVGFKKAVVEHIRLEVYAVSEHSVTLEVGEVTDLVTVTSEAIQVDKRTAELGTVIQEELIEELPLNGRGFLQLAGIQAGVQSGDAAPGVAQWAYGAERQTSAAISGTRVSSTSYVFDGIPFKEHFYGAPGAQVQIDAIAEFKVQKGFFTGRGQTPGVISVVTKSGTNEVHGSLWWFHRNDNVDARSFFDADLGEFRRHQWGFEVGGPAVKDQLHWYSSFEGLDASRFNTQFATVPSPAFLQGDFSSLETPVNDPLTGQPFPNNQIPSSRIHPFATQYLADGFIPTPNLAGTANNFTGAAPRDQKDRKWIFRADWNFTENDKLFGRVIHADSQLFNNSILSGQNVEFPLDGRNVVLNWTHVFSPSLVLDARAGLNRAVMSLAQNLERDSDPIWSERYGIRNINTGRTCNYAPRPSMVGYSAFGGAGNCIVPVNNDYYYMADTSYTTGRHELTWGFTYVDRFTQQLAASWTQGFFSFTGGITGNDVADFILGHPESATGASAGAANRASMWWDAYIEDRIRMTQNFSLTLALRYQVHPWLGLEAGPEQGNYLDYMDFARPRGGIFFGGPESLIATDYNDFAPRMGFAWTPGGSDDLVLRGSYGVFYDETPGNDLAWDSSGPQNAFINNAFSNDPRNPLDIGTLFADPPVFTPTGFNEILDVSAPIGYVSLITNERRSPYLQNWTMSVQKMFPGQVLFETAYVGSTGRKMSMRQELNRQLPRLGAPLFDQEDRPWPNIGFNIQDAGAGMSKYQSLQITVRKTSSNFTMLMGYTYGKTTDWDSFGSFTTYRLNDSNNGRSDWDMGHRLSLSWNYMLPGMDSNSAAVRGIMGGWQFGGITTINSGLPVSVRMSTDNSNTGTQFNARSPNRIGSGRLDNSTITKWFDTSAFELPPCDVSAFGEEFCQTSLLSNTYGNAGKGILDTDGIINFDFALVKNFNLSMIPTEQGRLQLRFEFFNAFNHPNFRGPNSNIQSAGFGTVNGALQGRQIQFALKMYF